MVATNIPTDRAQDVFTIVGFILKNALDFTIHASKADNYLAIHTRQAIFF